MAQVCIPLKTQLLKWVKETIAKTKQKAKRHMICGDEYGILRIKDYV